MYYRITKYVVYAEDFYVEAPSKEDALSILSPEFTGFDLRPVESLEDETEVEEITFTEFNSFYDDDFKLEFEEE